MIDHIWTVVCERAIVDSKRNDLYLHSILESILIPTAPRPDGILPIRFSVVSYWCRSDPDQPAKKRFRLIFASPSISKEVFIGEINLTHDLRHRYILDITTLPLSESGRHYFHTELEENPGEWKQVASTPVDVEFNPGHPQDISAEESPDS